MIVKQKALNEAAGKDHQSDNIKLSNFLYEKIMIQKACHCAFSLLVLCLQLKASYMRYKYTKMAQAEDSTLLASEKVELDDRVK